jgi:type II secretory pathway component PulF
MKAAWRGTGASVRERIGFLRTAAALIEAGFTLTEALEECARSSRNVFAMKQILSIRTAVAEGLSFSDALSRHPTFLPSIAAALIRSGEETGTLAQALSQAATIFEQQHQSKTELSTMLIYPSVVIGIALFAAVFLSLTVIPKVTALYSAAHAAVPLMTRLALAFGKIALPAAGSIAAVIALLLNRRVRSIFSGRMERLITNLPGLRQIRSAYLTGFWTGALGILLHRRIPFPDALDIASQSLDDPALKASFKRLRKRMEEGIAPGDAFASDSGFPDLAIRLIKAGDRSGSLPDMLERISKLYEFEYKMLSRRFMTLAEPVAILIAGLFVITIALAVILPVADLGGLLQ